MKKSNMKIELNYKNKAYNATQKTAMGIFLGKGKTHTLAMEDCVARIKRSLK